MKYQAGSQAQIHKLDAQTRKLSTLYQAFIRNSDIDRLYVPRTLGDRGLLSQNKEEVLHLKATP